MGRRRARPITCSRCQGRTHNVRTCKAVEALNPEYKGIESKDQVVPSTIGQHSLPHNDSHKTMTSQRASTDESMEYKQQDIIMPSDSVFWSFGGAFTIQNGQNMANEAKKREKNKTGTRQQSLNQTSSSGLSRDGSLSESSSLVSSKESLKMPSLPDWLESHEKLAGNAVFHEIHPQLGHNAKNKPKTAWSRITRDKLEKFRNRLNKTLGPARVKKTLERHRYNTSQSGSSVSSVGRVKYKTRKQRSKPGSTENRVEFLELLDDIGLPVMSVSEVLRNRERNDLSASAAENSQTTSWAESSRVSNINFNSVDMTTKPTLSGEMSQNTSVNSGNFTHCTDTTLHPNLTQCTSLPDAISNNEERQTGASLDRSDTLKQSVSIGSEGNCNFNTPIRPVILLSMDIDTPTTKKRPCPQPNLNRARSWLTSKQKDVPPEIRQAKLKQLLLNYERTKKNSPNKGNLAKKAPGPRFGIQLNIQSRPADVEDVAKKAKLVEILPEMRVRSSSESDSKVSFTTAATESTANLSSTINPPNINVPKPTETGPQQEPQSTSTPAVPPQPDSQTLNVKLLAMSEREESLHSSVRSLSLQEANMQCKIDDKIAVLTSLKTELEKMNERQLSVEALRKRHEQELVELRQERLMMLRGSIPAAHDTTLSQENIFQDLTPTCRRVHSTAFRDNARFPSKQPTEETIFQQKQPLAGDCAPVTSRPRGNSEMQTPNGVLQDFELSTVKSEPSSAVDDFAHYPVSSSKQTLNINRECLNIKEEIIEDCDVSVPYLKPNAEECSSQGTIDVQATQNANLTQTAEVDLIPAKKCQKQRTSSQRSPRFLAEGQQVQSTSTLPGEKLFPKFLKTHELPLVGLQLIKQGLVTCSMDETTALHTADGKKYSLTLGATPTAMAAISEDIISLVYVATQKLISKRQSSEDSVVVNKMEHWLNVYIVQNPESVAAETVFQPYSQLKMKTRVLCVHYDKLTLFCGMLDGIVAIITLNSLCQPEKDTNILECHSHSTITCLATGMEGARRILCCGSTDCTVSVLDAVEGLLLRTIQGHTKTVTCLQLVQNELYSASVDRLVLCHDLNTGNLLHRFTGHAGVVHCIYVASDVMVTLCSDRNIRFFDTKTSRLIQKPKPVSTLPLYACMSGLKNGASGFENIVFVGCEDSTVIQIRFPETQKPIRLSPTKNYNSNSPIGEKDRASSTSPQRITNLTGEFNCKGRLQRCWNFCD